MQYPNHQPAPGQQGQDVVPSLFPAPPPPPLPPGWEQANDPASGRIYFANRSTGETSWTPPAVHFPPPPPHNMLQPPPMQQVQQPNSDMYHQQQMMLVSAPAAVVQPQQQIMMAQPDMNNIQPFNNVSIMQSNYSTTQQQYVPNQPQVVIHTSASSEPSNIIHSVMQPNSHIQTPQQLETQTQTRINNSITSSGGGLGPSTATSQGMLVPSIRAMINEEYTQKVNQQQVGSVQSPPKLELEGLTAGAVADLCNVTREIKSRNNVDGGDFAEDDGGIDIVHKQQQQGQEGDDEADQYYAPLQPFTLPVSAIPPHIEPGRVDIRLHALHTKLGKI